MDPSLPPGPRLAVFKAAEEAGTVFALQTLVPLIVSSLWQRDAIHRDQRGSRVESRRYLCRITNDKEKSIIKKDQPVPARQTLKECSENNLGLKKIRGLMDTAIGWEGPAGGEGRGGKWETSVTLSTIKHRYSI